MQLRQLPHRPMQFEQCIQRHCSSTPCSTHIPVCHNSRRQRTRDLHVVAAKRGRPRKNPVPEQPSSESLADASWGDAFGGAQKQPASRKQVPDVDFGREDNLPDLGEEGELPEPDTVVAAGDTQLPPQRQPGAAAAQSEWPGDQGADGYEWDDDIEEFSEEAEEGDIAGVQLAQLKSGEAAALTTAADLVLSQDKELEEHLRIDIGDEDVDGPVPPAAYVDIYMKPRYDLSPGPPPPGDDQCKDLQLEEKDLENLPPEMINEVAFKLIAEQRWREEWDFEEYMEQMFEVQSRQWVGKNKYAQVLRMASIMNTMRVQDDFLPADVDLTNRPNMARAFLVFDREFKWFDRTFDVESQTRMSTAKLSQQDLLRYRSEFTVTREYAQKSLKRAEDPLAGLISDVLPGASAEAMEQTDYLQDLLPTESEVAASDTVV